MLNTVNSIDFNTVNNIDIKMRTRKYIIIFSTKKGTASWWSIGREKQRYSIPSAPKPSKISNLM
jgi:hypothetical protein